MLRKIGEDELTRVLFAEGYPTHSRIERDRLLADLYVDPVSRR
jgi:hypothetical protein